jgi:hypothetical protein
MISNFTLVSDLQLVHRRDFPLADRTLADPNGTNPLLDGEFMNFNNNYQLIRGADGTPGWAVFAEKGRFDVQALRKTTVLFGNTYEADTLIFTAAGITLLGRLQISASVTGPDGKTKSGLANYASGAVIGYVTRHPNYNGGKLRFIQCLV